MHCSGEADRKENLCQPSKIATTPSAPASEVKNTCKSAEPSWCPLSLTPRTLGTVESVVLQGEEQRVPVSGRKAMGCRRQMHRAAEALSWGSEGLGGCRAPALPARGDRASLLRPDYRGSGGGGSPPHPPPGPSSPPQLLGEPPALSPPLNRFSGSP